MTQVFVYRYPDGSNNVELSVRSSRPSKQFTVFVMKGMYMVHEMIDGTYRQTNLANESPEYLAKREELRQAEIELLRQRERVAELRRQLPKGATIQDYEFLEGPASLHEDDEPVTKVGLSELFTAPDRALVIYHFMF